MIKKQIDVSFVRSVLRYDSLTGRVFWLVGMGARAKAGREAGFLSQPDFVGSRRHIIKIFGVRYLRSRLAWAIHYGEDPGEFEVDHIDGDSSNDTLSNLRLATRSQNMMNKRKLKAKTSASKGVYLRENGRWAAALRFNGTSIHLGVFLSEEEAISARRCVARILHGGFYRD